MINSYLAVHSYRTERKVIKVTIAELFSIQQSIFVVLLAISCVRKNTKKNRKPKEMTDFAAKTGNFLDLQTQLMNHSEHF